PRCSIFFSHAPAPTAIYTLSLHDALPISLSQDLLPLGLGERDPELAGEIEHHLLFEREQLSERARHLTHGSYHAGTRHDRRGELDRGGPGGRDGRDGRGPLHHPLRPQQPADAR